MSKDLFYNCFYVYIYLDPRKPGKWHYKELEFDHQPFYVGIGKLRRMEDHLLPSSLLKNSIKCNIIRKIYAAGLEPIRYKIFENLNHQLAKDTEIDIISHFGRIKDGKILANITSGGEGMRGKIPSEETREKMRKARLGISRITSMNFLVKQLSLEGELVKTWNSIAEITRETNYTSGKIIYALNLSKHKTAYGFIWERGEKFKRDPKTIKKIGKTIYQYSLDGDFIQSFSSKVEARISTGINNIEIRSNRTINQSGGYQWFYENKGLKIDAVVANDRSHTKMKTSRPINCLNIETGIGKNYPSINEAARSMGIHKSTINKFLKTGEGLGFYWKYN